MCSSIALVLVLAGLSAAAPFMNCSTVQPDQADLRGALMQINDTHVQVNLTNTNNHSAALFARHTILHPGSEHFSLKVHPARNSSRNESVGLGEGALRFIYPRMVDNDSFVSITAGSSWTHTFDLTQVFNIPYPGTYRIELQETFNGVYVPSGTKNISRSTQLHPIHIKSHPVTVNLTVSASALERRATPDALAGCSSQRTDLLATIKAASDMANDALNKLSDAALLKTYFGLVQGQTDSETFNTASYEIAQTYGNIASYDPTKDTHIMWNCATSSNPLPSCTDSKLGFYLYKAKSINLCPGYATISKSLGCTQPSSSVPALDEQDGVVLHELFHDRTGFAPQNIVDFPDPNIRGYGCYNYQCATQFASQRSQDTPPERSAINYEQFAQSARYTAHPNTACVLASGSSSQTPPTPPTNQDADNYGPIGIDG